MLARPAIRLRRWLVIIAVTLVLLVGSAVALLRIRFEGSDLADTLCSMMNENMRGRIKVRSIEWPMSGMKSIVAGGWVPLTLHDIQVWDARCPPGVAVCPEAQLVLTSPRITAEIDIHALMFGRHDFVFRKIVVHGGTVLLREVAEPYPLHEYDTKVFSLLAAFYADRGAGYYAGISSGSPPLFDLRDFAIEDVDLEVRTKPYGTPTSYQFRAKVEDVSAEGFLYMDPSDPLVPKFYFSLAPTGGPGEIDLFWELAKDGSGWQGAYRFPLQRLAVSRMQQIPASWPVSPVANTLRFDLEIELTSKATAIMKGSMIEYWGNPYGGRWNVTVDVTNAGAMLREAFLPELGGDKVTIKTGITGPIVAYPRIELSISGLTYDLDLLGRALHLELETLHADYDLAVNKGSVKQFIGRGAGGALTLSATFEGNGSELEPFLVDARIAITDPLELSPWMTPCLRNLVGSTVSGHLRARRYKGDPSLIAQVDDFAFDIGRLRLTSEAPSKPGGTAGRLYADQYQSRLDFANVRARLGATTALVYGFYNWKSDAYNLNVKKGQAPAFFSLVRNAQRCMAELGAARPAPKAQPRRGGAPTRRTGSHHVRRRGAAIGGTRIATAPRAIRQAQAARPSTRRCAGGIGLDDIEASLSSDGTTTSQSSGTTNATCVPMLGTARVTYRSDGTTFVVESATSRTLGGLIRASGTVRLEPIWIERMRVLADNVDLARIPELDKLVLGRVAADVTVRGPPDPKRITAEGWACSNKVTVLGDIYTDVGVWLSRAPTAIAKCKGALPPDGSNAACLDVGKAGGRCMIARARREAGGEIALRVHADRLQRLGGAIGIADVPLSAIAALLGTTIPAGATLDAAELAVGGTVDAPTLSGTVRVTRGWLLDTFVGDGELTVRESGPGAIELTGTFLDGRLTLRGTLTTAAPYRLDVTIEATRVTIDSFVDLAKLTGLPTARAAMSGRVRVRTALGDPKAPLDVAIALSELTTTVAIPGFGATATPIDVRLASPVIATYDGQTLVLAEAASFETPFGTIAVVGKLAAAAVELSAKSTLDLGRARPLVGRVLDDLRGHAELSASVTGRLADPRITATLDLADVAVRLARQDAVLRVPEGRIALDDGEVSFTGLRLEVTDGYSDAAQAALRVSGGIVLEAWRPAVWNVLIEGDLAGEMLVAVAPAVIASATGVADLTVRLQGEGVFPPIDAVVVFDPARPLTILPRLLHHELALTEGTITLSDRPANQCAGATSACKRIEIDEVGGSLDGEGRLRAIRGTVDLQDWRLVGADVTASADALPYRVPRSLDLVLNVDGLRGVYNERDGLEVAGKVELVSGRYLRDVYLGDALVQRTSSVPAPPPFWESWPLVADARLELTVDARRFSVVNNIANIDMFGTLLLTGTPRDPRIEGTVSVQRGTFRIPALRPRFSRTSGTVTFSPLLPPGETPTLDITSEADYRDPTGQDHLITLVVRGSLGQPDWDLSTASGLNKAQTLTLIISGRTPEEFRRGLGQQAIGSDPTRVNPSTDASQGYTDELVRQTAGEFLTRAVEDTLRGLSGLDVARIEVNTTSFGFHGEKRVFENAQLVGDLERTTRGSTVNTRAELRLPWSTTAELSWLVKNFDDAAEKDVNDLEVKLVLRSFWRRVLGD